MDNSDNKDNFFSSLKLAKYGLGVRATSFVSFLAWTGVILSILGLLFSAQIIILAFTGPVSLIDYSIGGVLGALISSSWLALHLMLRKRNIQRDLHSIKRILKAKCFIFGGIEIISSVGGIVAVIFLLAESQNVLEMEYGLIFTGFFFLLHLAFSCSMIHGVRKDINSCINAYILFKIIYALTVFILSVSINANSLSSGISCILFIFAMIILANLFLYCNGGLIVLYNINDHSTSNMYNKNLEFINQAFTDEKMKVQA